MSWLWHGFAFTKLKRRKQCWYRMNCVACFFKSLWKLISGGYEK